MSWLAALAWCWGVVAVPAELCGRSLCNCRSSADVGRNPLVTRSRASKMLWTLSLLSEAWLCPVRHWDQPQSCAAPCFRGKVPLQWEPTNCHAGECFFSPSLAFKFLTLFERRYRLWVVHVEDFDEVDLPAHPSYTSDTFPTMEMEL